MLRRRGIPARRVAWILALVALLGSPVGCDSGREVAEVHRRLSLRLEHRPLERAPAGKDAEIRVRVQSSLEAPQLSAWIRIVDESGDKRIPLTFVDSGDAVGRIPAHARGETVRYAVEAKDAAGLVVSLPDDAADGATYSLRFEGRSSPLLGGTSLGCAWLASFFFLAAGAASVQALRGQLSIGPAGLLAGLAAIFVVFGVLLVGGVHAYQVGGRPWPSSPLLLALSRGDLALLTLLWVANLALGRRALLDDEPDGTRFDERIFATAGAAAGVLTLIFLLF